jgi:DNA end-binding protein Ku
MYSAAQESSLDLDMLDKKDHSNIRFMRVNEKTGKEVKWQDIVKGYDIHGKYVILDEKDFEKASPEKSKEIIIDQFVDQKQIDSVFYETPYYLEPAKSGVRPYVLLREALEKTGKVGVGTFVLRNREHLVVIKSSGDVIVANRIRFAEEIRKPELKIPESQPKPAEMKMAVTLISQLSGPFKIEKFKDTYSESLMKLIRAKAKGKAVVAKPLRVAHVNTKDLMAQLKASIEGTGTSKRKKAS